MLKQLEPISLADSPNFDERVVQDFIAEDPSVLGLGPLLYVGRERQQHSGGRLDLLLSDEEGEDRYCVEVQLGKTDPSHIIRTIEYWDSERKKNRAYDHIAVIIAEDITNRFFNVISILANSIPLIALQMTATRGEGATPILFSTVLDTTEEYFATDEDEEEELVTDREYWIERASKSTVGVADRLLSLMQEAMPSAELNYNKHYIGIRIEGRSRNFCVFHPRKTTIVLEIKLPQDSRTVEAIEHSGTNYLGYNSRNGMYKFGLKSGDNGKNDAFFVDLISKAHDYMLK